MKKSDWRILITAKSPQNGKNFAANKGVSGKNSALNTSLNSFNSNANPNFTGAIDGAVSVLKVLNEQPMLSVAVTDTVATNIPRTVVDYKATGPAGGFETLRREFSGLAVNCLMPSFFCARGCKAYQRLFYERF